MKRGQTLLGILVIGLGLVLLLANVLDINIWAFFWPALLIGLGLWVIFRPRMVAENTAVTQKFLGDIKRDGNWDLVDEDFSFLIGDVDLDLTQASIPPGVTNLTFSGLIGDIDLRFPADVGYAVHASGIVNDVKLGGEKSTNVFGTLDEKSANFPDSEQKVVINTSCLIGDIRIRS